MKQVFTVYDGNPNLTIFFAGWGADETPFKSYRPIDRDYMICYDYRDLDFDFTALKGYDDICIVGWSMGVWAASQIMGKYMAEGKAIDNKSHELYTIAYNGTPHPIDNLYGIPIDIYHKTTDGLTGASLNKFLRRMCGDADAYKAFLEVTPRRPIEELRDELINIEWQCKSLPRYPFPWMHVVISTEDKIIPPENQWRFWTSEGIDEKHTYYTDPSTFAIERLDLAHYDEEMLHGLLLMR
jgi:biotin synthesis protein BioG